MFHFEFFYLDKTVIFKIREVFLPVIIEFLEFLITDFDIFCQLFYLDVLTKIILVVNDILFQLTNFSHKVFESLIFKNVT